MSSMINMFHDSRYISRHAKSAPTRLGTVHARISIAEASNSTAQRYTRVQTATKWENRHTAGMDFTHLWLHVISLRYVTQDHSLAYEGEGWVQSQNGECGQLTWQWTRFFSKDWFFPASCNSSQGSCSPTAAAWYNRPI